MPHLIKHLTLLSTLGWVCASYAQNGVLDVSYGDGGIATFPVGGSIISFDDMIVLGDGRVLTGGEFQASNPDANTQMYFARVLADGQLDTTYGDAGVTPLNVCLFQDNFVDMCATYDGKVAVAMEEGAWPATAPDGAVFMMTADGVLDTVFSPPVSTDIPYWPLPGNGPPGLHVHNLVYQPLGRVVVHAEYADTWLRGYGIGGELDPSFGDGDGMLTVDGGPRLIVDPASRLYFVVRNTEGLFDITRMAPDGSLDSTYGTAGHAVLPYHSTTSIAAAMDDASRLYLVAGDSGRYYSYRVLADGSLDPEYGYGLTGTSFLDTTGIYTNFDAQLTLVPDGRCFVRIPVGQALLGLTTLGTLDVTFANGGRLVPFNGCRGTSGDSILYAGTGGTGERHLTKYLIHPTDISLGLAASSPTDQAHLYPNPCMDGILILPSLAGAGGTAMVEIRDAMGALVRQEQMSRCAGAPLTLQLGDLPSGMYTIGYRCGSYAARERVLVLR